MSTKSQTTTQEVLDTFIRSSFRTSKAARVAFDRWLAQHEAEIREQVAAEIEAMAREALSRDTSTSLDVARNQQEADQLRAIAARIARTPKETDRA